MWLPAMWSQTGYPILCAILSSFVRWGRPLHLSPGGLCGFHPRVLGKEVLGWEPGIQQAPREFRHRNCSQGHPVNSAIETVPRALCGGGLCTQQQFRAYFAELRKQDVAKLSIAHISRTQPGNSAVRSQEGHFSQASLISQSPDH